MVSSPSNLSMVVIAPELDERSRLDRLPLESSSISSLAKIFTVIVSVKSVISKDHNGLSAAQLPAVHVQNLAHG